MSEDYSENLALFSKPQSTYTGEHGGDELTDTSRDEREVDRTEGHTRHGYRGQQGRPSPSSIFRGGGPRNHRHHSLDDEEDTRTESDVPSTRDGWERGREDGGGGGQEPRKQEVEAPPLEREKMNVDEVEECPLFDEVLGTVHEKALSAAGFGRLQWTLFVVLGLGIMGDGIELMVIAYILPGAERELCMDEQMKGWLGKRHKVTNNIVIFVYRECSENVIGGGRWSDSFFFTFAIQICVLPSED